MHYDHFYSYFQALTITEFAIMCNANGIQIKEINELFFPTLLLLPSIFSCSISSEKSDANAASLLKPRSVFFFAKYRVSIFAKVCRVLWAWSEDTENIKITN